MSTVRCISSKSPGPVMGEVKETPWTVIAAEIDGEIDEDEVGKHYLRRTTQFAFLDEARAWIAEQEANGWTASWGPAVYATAYFGPTDSPGNCWSVEVQKEVPKEQIDGLEMSVA
jgi:hypothetical protein